MENDEKFMKMMLKIVFISDEKEKTKWRLAEQLIMRKATELGYCEYHENDNMYYLSRKGIELVDE